MDHLNKNQWTPEQLVAIELLAEGGHPYEEVAEHCKTSSHTIYNWRKDPQFMDEVIRKARENLKRNLPDIYRTLTSNAKEGNVKHIELVLKHLERLEEMKTKYAANSITFTWEPPYDTDRS